MGLTAAGTTRALLRAGARRPHVLVAAMPGGTAVRLAVEEQVRRRGWPVASGPADADIVAVAGAPDRSMAEVVDRVWRDIPAPRVRAVITHAEAAAEALTAAQRDLAAYDEPSLRDLGDRDASDRDRSDRGAGRAGEEEPPMADRGDDRDGLKLDELHVPIGPILPGWPAGLVAWLTLQGDVITDARMDWFATAAESYWTGPWRRAAAGAAVSVAEAARRRVAAHLDSLGRLLLVAGWDDAVTRAHRLREETLAGAPASRLRPALRRFCRRVERSRTLRWLTEGLGVLTADDAIAAGIAGPVLRAGGDVAARYRAWCAETIEIAQALDDRSPLDPAVLEPPRGRPSSGESPSEHLLAALPRLIAGSELAAARLIVASLDPDVEELPVRQGASHGG